MPPLVELKDVTRIYSEGTSSEVIAVNHVNLCIETGRFVILMGPSGSGKTTLLMLLGGLLKPTSGVVSLLGTEISRLSEKELPYVRRRQIGFIFQGFNLFPALTALENVEATLNVKGVRGKKAEEQATALLQQVGLSGRMHHLPEDLSGGEKQRVAVARALAGEPPIILADEPTAALDSKTGRAIVGLLKELSQRENRLVFMVSHDNRILDYADEILYMNDGMLLAREDEEGSDRLRKQILSSVPPPLPGWAE
jgi:putative ABC transport system ATP-binding protein